MKCTGVMNDNFNGIVLFSGTIWTSIHNSGTSPNGTQASLIHQCVPAMTCQNACCEKGLLYRKFSPHLSPVPVIYSTPKQDSGTYTNKHTVGADFIFSFVQLVLFCDAKGKLKFYIDLNFTCDFALYVPFYRVKH